MATRKSLKNLVIDAAVARAEVVGWANVRLRDVADTLGVSLADVRRHYHDLDAVADAWFERADLAMLVKPDDRGFALLEPKERLCAVITRWLEAQSKHRNVVRGMLATKLYPGHPHYNIALILRLSRTVQWIREAAHLDATGRRRQVEEIGLTALFAAAVTVWLRDGSDGQTRAREFLENSLTGADNLMVRLFENSSGKTTKRMASDH